MRKVRNSVFFLDILLAVAAIAALVGLVTFVQVRGTKNDSQATKKSTLSINNSLLTPLSEQQNTTTDNPSTNNSSNAHVKGAQSNKQCGGRSCSSTLPIIPVSEPVEKCDEIEQQLLLQQYNAQVANLAPDKSLTGTQNEDYSNTTLKLLAELKANLNKELEIIYCPTVE